MKNITVKGVEFEVDVDWEYGDEKKIEKLQIYLPFSEVELSDVLDEKVLQDIESAIYKEYPEGGMGDINEDQGEDR